MELSYRYSNCKQVEIGAIFGVDYSTVSQSRVRLKGILKSSRKLNIIQLTGRVWPTSIKSRALLMPPLGMGILGALTLPLLIII